MINNFLTGEVVFHPEYGEGKIVFIQNDYILVTFNSGKSYKVHFSKLSKQPHFSKEASSTRINDNLSFGDLIYNSNYGNGYFVRDCGGGFSDISFVYYGRKKIATHVLSKIVIGDAPITNGISVTPESFFNSLSNLSSTIYLLMLIAIIDMASKTNTQTILISELVSKVITYYDSQLKHGKYINDELDGNPLFFDVLTDNQKNRAQEISHIIKKYYLHQMLVFGGNYITNLIEINERVLKLKDCLFKHIKENAKKLKNSLVSKVAYFLKTKNKNSPEFEINLYAKFLKTGVEEVTSQSVCITLNDLEEIKNKLTSGIHDAKYVKSLIADNGFPNDDATYQKIIALCGYKDKNNEVIYRSKYSTIDEYYEHSLLIHYSFEYENPHNYEHYDIVLKNMINKYQILEVSNGKYFTCLHMNKFGIDKKAIKEFKNKLVKLAQDNPHFTSSMVLESSIFDGDPMIDYSGGDIFQIDQFVGAAEGVKRIQVNGRNIFTFSDEPFSVYKIVKHFMGDKESISVSYIQSLFYDLFGEELSDNRIKYSIKDTGLFYSEEMEKIYKNKNVYYKEVFEDED